MIRSPFSNCNKLLVSFSDLRRPLPPEEFALFLGHRSSLDRLARNVAFLSALMDSKVPFVACDNPHANRLTLHILAWYSPGQVGNGRAAGPRWHSSRVRGPSQ